MSVWGTTTYKLDIAKQVYENLRDFHGEILGYKVSDYLSPVEGLSKVFDINEWEDLAFECKWDESDPEPTVADKFKHEFGSVKAWYVGSSALYQIINAVSRDKFKAKSSYRRNLVDETAKMLGRLIVPSTQIAMTPFLARWGRRNELLWERGQTYEDVAEGFKYMRFAFQPKADGMKKIDQIRFFGAGERVYYGYTLGSLCLLKGVGDYAERALIFTKNHLNLLVEGLMRIANIYYYLATEYVDEDKAADVVVSMLKLTISSSFKAKRKNADKVVQAFHKARMLTQMHIFHNCHVGAIKDAELEYIQKGLPDVVSLTKYLELVQAVPINRRLDVIQVYKWMFPPDFDSTYSFDDLHKLHMNPRPSGADPGAPIKLQADWLRIQDERKRNIAIAYHQKTREWPISAQDESVRCQPNNLHMWELQKIFDYHAYGKDILVQVKDKATVSGNYKKELEGRVRIDESSFLLWYMAHGHEVDTEQDAILLQNRQFPEDNFARVAYKGEAHKPGSRLFFMAPPRIRCLLGELEGNISTVAHYYPGSLQGKDSHQKSEMMQKLFDVYEPPPEVDPTILSEVFVITFDLSKFSPKSNYNVTRDYHQFWATVFGYEPILSMSELGPKSRIIHTQSGLNMEYMNIGADLEGFRGRMMTLFHADMLGAACRKAKEEGIITGKAILAVFIDDGAVKIATVGEGAEALRNANKFLMIMQDIYAAAGQENHPNKTIVSQYGGELLAEQYLFSVRLKVPIKAAMRLYPDYENPACAITEEFDSIFAASQGCVKDQGEWSPTYYRYAVAFIKSIERWDRHKFPTLTPSHLAFKIITPKALGGFGIQPWQGLVSTASLNLTAEGIGMLNRIARAYPELGKAVIQVISRPLVTRDWVAKLRDPSRIRVIDSVLIENRLMMAIIRKLSEPNNPAAKFMAGYKAEELIEHAEAVSKALFSSEAISFPVILSAWQATPLAYVESVVGKFRRAKSIINMLGPKSVSSVRRANAQDVTDVLG